MRSRQIDRARVSIFLAAGLLGALASVGCGEDDPAGKSGGGLGASNGKGGSIGVGGSSTGGSKSGSTGGSVAVGGTAGSSTGGTVSVGGTAGSSSGGDAPLGDGSACAAVSRDSNKAEVALLFMVDISGSMNCPVPELDPACEVDPNMAYDQTRWTEMSPALKAFFSSAQSDGMWAGINFFSKNSSCDASDYERPEAEIDLLPGAATALNDAVDAQDPGGQTPTVPSLQGALNHANDWADNHADQNVVVVYATDGYPKGCDGNDPANTIDNAAAAAATAFQGAHQIRTYVLGVGPNLDDLNKIAQSGGTDAASLIDTGQDVTAQLTEKFNEIRMAVAVECTYSVPTPPAGQVLDPNKVNVNYTSGSADPVAVGYNDAADCNEGWQYADNMQQIVLCGSTCDTVKADPDASIQVLFGCSTVSIDEPH